jgi:hypothetical protein
MDLSKSISYRGLELNGVALETGRTLRGIAVENVDYSAIEVTAYTEKRAGSDGIHASDVYLGARRVEMSGHVYAANIAEMFDYLHVLRSVFSPTSAYQDSPGDRGFLPMHVQQSTEDHQSFPALTVPVATPAGLVPLYMNLRPTLPVRFNINRDRQDASSKVGTIHGTRPTAIPWNVTLAAKDPRVYIDPDQSVPIDGAAASGGGGNATNRGDYETPLNVILIIGATVPPVSEFRITGLNGIDMRIKIEAKANTVYRWFGDDRVLMTEDIAGGSGINPLILRMDLVTFHTKQRKPMVPASINPPSRPFTTPFLYWRGVALAAGSRLFWSEAFA